MKPNHVWVIEMEVGPHYPERKVQWKPCEEFALQLTAAARKLSRWRRDYPDDRFRVTKYVATGGER